MIAPIKVAVWRLLRFFRMSGAYQSAYLPQMILALIGLLIAAVALIYAIARRPRRKRDSEWDANLPGGYRMFDDSSAGSPAGCKSLVDAEGHHRPIRCGADGRENDDVEAAVGDGFDDEIRDVSSRKRG